jgi:hypothetical protein
LRFLFWDLACVFSGASQETAECSFENLVWGILGLPLKRIILLYPFFALTATRIILPSGFKQRCSS